MLLLFAPHTLEAKAFLCKNYVIKLGFAESGAILLFNYEKIDLLFFNLQK